MYLIIIGLPPYQHSKNWSTCNMPLLIHDQLVVLYNDHSQNCVRLAKVCVGHVKSLLCLHAPWTSASSVSQVGGISEAKGENPQLLAHTGHTDWTPGSSCSTVEGMIMNSVSLNWKKQLWQPTSRDNRGWVGRDRFSWRLTSLHVLANNHARANWLNTGNCQISL